MSVPSLTVVLPTLNEEGNIRELIDEIFKSCADFADTRVIVVDDASDDETVANAKLAGIGDARAQVIQNRTRIGLGASIGTGLRSAKTDFVVVMDADFTHDPKEIPRLLGVALVWGFASGSRYVQGGSMEDPIRMKTSQLFQLILRRILGLKVRDLLGGFWACRIDFARPENLAMVYRGYGDYFFRLVSHLVSSGIMVVEVPSMYALRRRGKSKSRVMNMFFGYIKEAFLWRFRGWSVRL